MTRLDRDRREQVLQAAKLHARRRATGRAARRAAALRAAAALRFAASTTRRA